MSTGLPSYLESIWYQYEGSDQNKHGRLEITPENFEQVCEDIARRAASTGILMAKQQMLLALDSLVNNGDEHGQSTATNH